MSDYLGPDANPVTPYLTVRDPDKMVEFYQKAFGFTENIRVPGDDGKPVHIGMDFQGRVIVMFSPQSYLGDEMKAPATSGAASPITIYVYCPDVDALFKQAIAAGAKEISAPQDMFWGDRLCRLADPDGYRWDFATHTGNTGAPPKN